jgi:predicted metalloprotease/RsiW-degrading membrane proteinase PrsW (M82 family)
VLVALVVAWVYLTIVRFVDVNEREPVWGLAIAFIIGAVAAAVVRVVVSPVTLQLSTWGGAFAEETVKFAALAATVAILAGIGRIRGWSEFMDLFDGIVYGLTVGLGFSTGETLIRELATQNLLLPNVGQTAGEVVINSALGGLSQGLYTSVAGIGFGLALDLKTRPARILMALAGLLGAAVLNGLFRILAHGNGFGGSDGLVRAWLALLVPLAAVIAVGIYSLSAERSAIRAELAPEVESGTITQGELDFLSSFWPRQLTYFRMLLQGKWSACFDLAARHNHLTQLALTKRRMSRMGTTRYHDGAAHQVDRLRHLIKHARTAAVAGLVLLLALGGADWLSSTEMMQQGGQGGPSLANGWTVPTLVAAAQKDIGGYWQRQLGAGYQPPRTVEPYSAASGCTPLKNNAAYCRGNRSIYYDPPFFQELLTTVGDFAPWFVLAHEWGHLIQHLEGQLGPESGHWQVQVELQADCLAGQYSRDAGQRRLLEPGDTAKAINALFKFRDPDRYPWNAPDAHGRAGQRVDAFLEGINGHQCDGSDFWKLIGVESRSAELPPTPNRGSLLETTLREKGRFKLVDIHAMPSWVQGTVTDAITATYRAPDGGEVQLNIMLYTTNEATQAAMDRIVANIMSQSYTLTKEGPVERNGTVTGKWKVLSGKTEVVLFSNGQKLEGVEGPTGLAWEFATATAPSQPKK